MPKRGAPKQYTPQKIKAIQEKIDEYTDNTPVPIVAEFAYLNNIRKATLYEIPELSYSIKRMIEKKEFQLEKMAMTNKINSTFAIFSLKQLGWRDKQEIDLTGEIKTPSLVPLSTIMGTDEPST